MCGVFGWQLSKPITNSAQKALAKALASGADDRGGQSWGVWSPAMTVKGLGPAAPNTAHFRRQMSVIGHSRWATHGANVTENAHPFFRGGLAFVHNGVVSNHRELNEKHKRTNEVDSLHILDHMLEGKPFDEIESYGVIVWADTSDTTIIKLALLSERADLTVAKLKGGGLVWASLDTTVREACKLAGLKIDYTYELEAGQEYWAMEGSLYVPKDTPKRLVGTRKMVDWRSFGDFANPTAPSLFAVDGDSDWRTSWAKDNETYRSDYAIAEKYDALSHKVDAAKWWLEDTAGVSEAAFDGMTDEQIIQAADDLGFDFGKEFYDENDELKVS